MFRSVNEIFFQLFDSKGGSAFVWNEECRLQKIHFQAKKRPLLPRIVRWEDGEGKKRGLFAFEEWRVSQITSACSIFASVQAIVPGLRSLLLGPRSHFSACQALKMRNITQHKDPEKGKQDAVNLQSRKRWEGGDGTGFACCEHKVLFSDLCFMIQLLPRKYFTVIKGSKWQVWGDRDKSGSEIREYWKI